MSEQLYRSYDNFNFGAIQGNNGASEDGWKENITGGTPINSDNLNAMLQMLIYIRNVIGKTGDFADTINSTTITKPATGYDKDANGTTIEEHSLATYLKDAFDAIIGDTNQATDTESTITRTLAGLKKYLESLDVTINSDDHNWIRSITQTDGKITAEYSQPDASDITYTKDSLGTNLESSKTVDDALDKLDQVIGELLALIEEEINDRQNAINALDFSCTDIDSSKTVSAIIQNDGKITNFTTQDISIEHSQVSDFEASVKAITVPNAEKADEATKATQDSSGNNIVNTYATKQEVSTLSTKVDNIQLLDDKVTLSAPYTFTKDFGYYTLGNDSYKEFGEKGQTLRSFLEGAFSQVDNNVLTDAPTYSVSISGNTSAEIGTKITPEATVIATPGSYKYGTSTQKQTGITYSNSTLSPTSFDELIYDSTSKTLNVSATATRYAATNSPINNLAQQIDIPTEIASKKTVTATASKTFTGYREGCFYGSVSNISNASAISSTIIRNLDNKLGTNYTSGTYNHTVAVGDTAIIVACPVGKPGVTKIYNSTVNAEMTSSFTKISVNVSGANNYSPTSYNVWYYIPTSGAYTQTAALQITLG